MVWLNIGCGPHRAPAPWVNTDVVRLSGHIEPDLVVDDPWILPLADQPIERLYMGHLLEHLPWNRVHGFLEHCRTRLVSGGQLCVVGPDVRRTLELWKAGAAPDFLVEAVLEDDTSNPDTPGTWEGARHQWNCYESRVVQALTHVGFVAVTPRDMATPAPPLTDWPVVAYTSWQFAVTAVAP